MGLYIPNFSRCSRDSGPSRSSACPGRPSECPAPRKPRERAQPEPRNPNPEEFKVLRSKEVTEVSCVLEIEYKNVTNYEGRKILVYAHPLEVVLLSKRLDPHFCDHEGCISPFARFEPTSTGWLAALFAAQWIGVVWKP